MSQRLHHHCQHHPSLQVESLNGGAGLRHIGLQRIECDEHMCARGHAHTHTHTHTHTISYVLFLLLQIRSVAQSCLTLCNPMNHSTSGLPFHHQLLEFTETHVHRVNDAIQPSHPLSSPSPPAPNPSQHQSLFQRVSSSHEVAKVLEFQL